MATVKGGCAVSFQYPKPQRSPAAISPELQGPSILINNVLLSSKTPKTPSGPPSGKSRRKALGQHFLTSGAILNRIVKAAELTAEDLVVEIGPGAGAMTGLLLEQAGRVVAVEVDGYLAKMLTSRLGNPPALTVLEADARYVDLVSLVPKGQSYKVAANLPYYAANPIVRRFLEAVHKPSLMVLTLQQEVAEAMTAEPGKMNILSVAVQFYAEATLVCTVPASAFRPPPKVTSAVVQLVLRSTPAVEVDDADGFFGLVRAGFSAPRKKLRNSLGHGLALSGAAADGLLAQAEVDGHRRPATLSLAEWADLYRAWSAYPLMEDPRRDAKETG